MAVVLPSALITILVWSLFSEPLNVFAQSDVECLRAIKGSLEDPLNNLASWNFDNSSGPSICKFAGIECWHDNDNKILNMRLPGMGLKGEFPQGIAGCASLTGLDLSRNNIRGNLPSNISNLIAYVTNLDLSSNQLTGEIPASLANCTFLNFLKLDSNQLTGQIPPEIGRLNRIKTFTVANNRLSGPVPIFVNFTAPAESYVNNAGLCGGPLKSCGGGSKPNHTPIIGAAVGGLTVAILAFAIGMFFLRRFSKKKRDTDPLGNRWARNIKGAKRFKLSMFENKVSKMNLNDLMRATNEFSKENIIGSGRTGTMYKAVLEDGTSLMVKRLQDTQHSEKEFSSEMATLGSIKHRNLVPLLGFCVAKRERLLVYQYMPNGTLHDKLHTNDGVQVMDWPLRLKVGIRAAKGFAWLHHSCNPRIIHRNISSKCILLDADYEPKISDFGLARLMNPVDTHLSTFVNGEFGDIGYVAPEYAQIPPIDGTSGLSPQTTSVLAFHGKNVPSISILSYLSRIHKYCPTTYEVFLSLLVYFDRMTERVNAGPMLSLRQANQQSLERSEAAANTDTAAIQTPSNAAQAQAVTPPPSGSLGRPQEPPSQTSQPPSPPQQDLDANGYNLSHFFIVDSFNIHRLVIAGVTCASKFFSDVFYTNSRYAKVGGLPLVELNHLELQFLLLNDFRLAVPLEEMEAYGTMLVEFYAREVVEQHERQNGARQ